MKYLMTFLGGAIVGAAVALLFAPEKGEELRGQIKEVLRRNGLIKAEDEEMIVNQIIAELKEQ